MARQVSILGATGSIGRSTVDLLARAPQDFTIEALTANRDVAGLAATARRLRAKLAVIGDEGFYQPLKEALAGPRPGRCVSRHCSRIVGASARPRAGRTQRSAPHRRARGDRKSVG